ncbi:MAG: hypothetical protein JNJ46_11785 [Myxococcales bacterium]|nr:hypothetical protein [Myxococcales bacterium]
MSLLHSMGRWLAGLVVVAVLFCASLGHADPTVAVSPTLPTPLPQAWAEAFSTLAADPRPPSLVRDTHYIVSNEDNHFVWRTQLEGRGGIYVGVGTDQNYLLAGWARPELLVLLDFDQVVVDLHRVYGVIFLNSPTPHDFLDLWEDRNVRRVEELIEALKVDAPTRRGMLAAYRMAHFAVPRRLRRVEAAYKPLGIRWFLNDMNQYRYLVELFRTGRVIAVRGDLSIGGAMSAVAGAAQRVGGVVRTLYLSNAERYFPYTAGFKQSMLALPTDDKSLVVRTRARMNGAYEYIVQDAGNFKRWLEWGKMSYAVELTRYRELDSVTGAYFIRREPPQPKSAPKAGADKASADKASSGTRESATASTAPESANHNKAKHE